MEKEFFLFSFKRNLWKKNYFRFVKGFISFFACIFLHTNEYFRNSRLKFYFLRFIGVSNNDSAGADSHRFSAQQDANFWALLLLGVPVFTALGNMLVVVSVLGERALQTSTNYLIVSLAVADFLVAILVMPWGMYVLVSEKS